MKGIDNIISRLEADAQAEIDTLNAETKVQCESLLAEYQQKADEAYEARMKAGKEAAAAHAERVASAADLDARKALLSFKQEMVGAVFDKAAQRLTKLPKDEYVKFLASQAAKACEGQRSARREGKADRLEGDKGHLRRHHRQKRRYRDELRHRHAGFSPPQRSRVSGGGDPVRLILFLERKRINKNFISH